MNYYNEFDPYAAQWLRNLVSAGLIPPGHVDERSITDVTPGDLSGFTQCHFFAGIGGWSLALKLAGIEPSTRLWTGSCPCQPFSAAGKRKGTEDERHLWPVFRDLIAQCRPPVVFGEQVASADGRDWLSTVRSEMEALGYAVGASDLCAAGIGAPHIRQRLYFVGLGDSANQPCERNPGSLLGAKTAQHGTWIPVDGALHLGSEHAGSGMDRLADATVEGEGRRGVQGSGERAAGESSMGGGLANTESIRDDEPIRHYERKAIPEAMGRSPADIMADGGRPGSPDSFWRTADWLFCRDGKWRPVEPGTQPLAHGIPNRMGRLRAYGNAIVPQVAATFIKAALNP